MNPGDLVVAGHLTHLSECPSHATKEGTSCRLEMQHARLLPLPSDWGTPVSIKEGTLGLVLCRLKPTGFGREWRRVMVMSPTQSMLGWMCQGDGWARP